VSLWDVDLHDEGYFSKLFYSDFSSRYYGDSGRSAGGTRGLFHGGTGGPDTPAGRPDAVAYRQEEPVHRAAELWLERKRLQPDVDTAATDKRGPALRWPSASICSMCIGSHPACCHTAFAPYALRATVWGQAWAWLSLTRPLKTGTICQDISWRSYRLKPNVPPVRRNEAQYGLRGVKGQSPPIWQYRPLPFFCDTGGPQALRQHAASGQTNNKPGVVWK
jgi:hypothetical protein